MFWTRPISQFAVFFLAWLVPAAAWGQVSRITTIGNPEINTGLQSAGLRPTESYLAPGVGAMVGLARHGFATPNFSWSFMHPMSAFNHPLSQSGVAGGGAGGPGQPAGGLGQPVGNRFPGPRAGIATGVNSDTLAAAEAAERQNPTDVVQRTGPQLNSWSGGAAPAGEANLADYSGPTLYGAPPTGPASAEATGEGQPPKLFVDPTWHHAARHSVLWPHLGFYGHYGKDGGRQGMFVAAVALYSIGHQMGLAPGDVITSIGGTAITNPHVYMKAVRDAKGDTPVVVWDPEKNRESTLTLNFDKYAPPVLQAEPWGNPPIPPRPLP